LDRHSASRGRLAVKAKSVTHALNIARGAALAEAVVRTAGIPGACLEHRFHPTRKWRFDAAWPALKLAVEVEGGAFVAGRHSRGAAFEADCEKYAEAAILGWTVLRVTPRHVRNGTAAAWVRRWAHARGFLEMEP